MFFSATSFYSFFFLLTTVLALLIITFSVLLIFEAFIGLFCKKSAEKTVDIPINNKTTDGGAASCVIVCVACI